MRLTPALYFCFYLICLFEPSWLRKPSRRRNFKFRSEGRRRGIKKADDFSYMVGLAYTFDQSVSPFCAGALVSASWVITSASCVYSDTKIINKDKLVARLGLKGEKRVVGVAKVFKHSHYWQGKNSGSNGKNIALLKLAEAQDTTKYKPVCLSVKKSWQSLGPGVLVGWRLDPLGALTQLQQRKISVEKCKSKGRARDRGKLCSSPESQGCEGDFGGPLLEGSGGSLLGVMVSDKGCGQNGQGIYTRVEKYVKWIKKKMKANGGVSICRA